MRKFVTLACFCASLVLVTGCEAANSLVGSVSGLLNTATSGGGVDLSSLLSQLQGLLGQ